MILKTHSSSNLTGVLLSLPVSAGESALFVAVIVFIVTFDPSERWLSGSCPQSDEDSLYHVGVLCPVPVKDLEFVRSLVYCSQAG